MKKSLGVLIGILMVLMFASSANAEVVLIDKTYSYDSDKYNFSAQYPDPTYGVTIEIKSVQKIEDGIEILARAWKDGKQLGFGKDGSVEIERFRIYNPPILVDDPNGDIVRESIDDKTGEIRRRILREDPIQAIRESLAHTIHLVGKEGTNIVKGKIGSTTSTFYPDPDVESTSVDGLVNNDPVSAAAWATIHGATAGTGAKPSAILDTFARVSCHTTSNTYDIITRSFFLFDTFSIPDADTIDSAILSIKGNGGTDTWVSGTKPNINIVASTPASNTDLVTGDFDQLGTTAFSTAKTTATWSTSAYNDFTLNASGLAAISKTDVSKFGARDMIYDAPNVAPTWASGQQVIFQGNYTDTVGTSSDPKLVVEHSAIIPDTTPPIISQVSSSNITSNSATITWTTDESSTSQVEYGLTTAYGTQTTLDSNLVTNHSVNLSGLTSNTTYHYRVKSKDAANNEAISGDYTFHTQLSLRLPFRSGESWKVTCGYNGQGGTGCENHTGTDAYALDFNWGTSAYDDQGKPVLAVAPGKVEIQQYSPNGYGNHVLINHGNGYKSRYAHLNSIDVKDGQFVFQGEQIGTVGETGQVSGPHLHFAMYKDGAAYMPEPMSDHTNFTVGNTYLSTNTMPVAIYHLDRYFVTDSSDKNNNGYLQSGPVIKSGTDCVVGNCLNFNSSSDYLEAPDSPSLSITGANISIAGWLKTSSLSTQWIVSKYNNGASDASYGLYLSNGYVKFTVSPNGSAGGEVQSTVGVNDGNRRHVVVTYNGTDLTIYIDGAVNTWQSYVISNIFDSSSPLRIGAKNSQTAMEFFSEMLDELVIYDRTLTADEVNNMYYSSKP